MLRSICRPQHSHTPHLHITLLVITAVIHALVFVSSPLQQKIRNISMLGDFFLPWFQVSAVSFCCLEAGVTDEKGEAHCTPLLLLVLLHPSLGRAWSRVPGQISLQPPLPVINQSRCRQPRPRPEDGDGGWRMLPQPDMQLMVEDIVVCSKKVSTMHLDKTEDLLIKGSQRIEDNILKCQLSVYNRFLKQSSSIYKKEKQKAPSVSMSIIPIIQHRLHVWPQLQFPG